MKLPARVSRGAGNAAPRRDGPQGRREKVLPKATKIAFDCAEPSSVRSRRRYPKVALMSSAKS